MIVTKKINFKRISTDKYFLNVYKGKKSSAFYNNKIKNGILRTSETEITGDPLSSVNFNKYINDMKYNIENIQTNLNELSNVLSFDDFSFGKSILQFAYDLNNRLSISSLNKENYLFNFYLGKGFDDAIRFEDPRTNSILDNNYYFSFIEGKGFTLPIKKLLDIPVLNIEPSFDYSEIGEEIIEEIYDYEDKSYSILFSVLEKNPAGNAFTSKEKYKLGININIAGYQQLNRIKVNSYNSFNIDSIWYMAQDESLVELSDFSVVDSIGETSIVFSNIIAKSILVVFSIKNPFDYKYENEKVYKIYYFSFSKISLFKDKFAEFAFLKTNSFLQKNLSSIKTLMNKELNESEIVEDLYVHIQNSSKKIKVLLKDNYQTTIKQSLYFRNGIAELDFYPSSLTLYKNGEEQVLGTDYWILSSIVDTPQSTLTTLDSEKQQTISIKLNYFNPTSYYTISIIPDLNYKLYGDFYYTNDSVVFNKELNSNLYFSYFLRKINPKVTSLPIIKSLSVKFNVA